MKNKVSTRWFIYCCEDAKSNEVAASALSSLKGANTEFSHLLCADGNHRHLYEVPDYLFAHGLYKSQKELGAKFQIFLSLKEGKPQHFVLSNKKKITMSQVKKASDKIKCRQ